MKDKVLRMIGTIPVALIVLGLVATSGVAAWLIMLQRDSTVNVDNENPLHVNIATEFIGLQGITAVGGDDTASDTLEIYSADGANQTISYTLTSTDVADDCTDYVADCSMSVSLDGSPLVSGGLHEFGSGETRVLEFAVDCVEYSCPQELKIDVEIGA